MHWTYSLSSNHQNNHIRMQGIRILKWRRSSVWKLLELWVVIYIFLIFWKRDVFRLSFWCTSTKNSVVLINQPKSSLCPCCTGKAIYNSIMPPWIALTLRVVPIFLCNSAQRTFLHEQSKPCIVEGFQDLDKCEGLVICRRYGHQDSSSSGK